MPQSVRGVLGIEVVYQGQGLLFYWSLNQIFPLDAKPNSAQALVFILWMGGSIFSHPPLPIETKIPLPEPTGGKRAELLGIRSGCDPQITARWDYCDNYELKATLV